MKRNKITLKLLLMISFIGFSIIMISINLITTNIMLKNEFLYYIDKKQEDEVKKIIDDIKKEYQIDNEISYELVNKFNEYARNGFIIDITFKDKVIYDGFIRNESQISNIRKDSIQEESKTLKYYDNIYAKYQNKIEFNNKSFDVFIYMYRPLYINSQGFEHLDSLNNIFIYVGAIALSIALVLGYILTNILSAPLKKLINKFYLMKQGEYENEIEISSTVFEYQEIERSFNDLNNSLNKQKMIRKNLSSDISHELRTPLTAIILTLENIEEDIWTFNKDVSKSLLSQTKKMQTLIDDIHKLEEVQANVYHLNIEKIIIRNIIDNTIILFKPMIDKKNLIININIKQEIIYGDLNRIKQVVMNLISNAIKYNKQDGFIDINVYLDGDSNIISIKDSGVGIRKEIQNRIFERFYRDNQHVDIKGTGIGLTVVNDIIKAHNGEVLVFSEEDKGCEIVVVLKNDIRS